MFPKNKAYTTIARTSTKAIIRMMDTISDKADEFVFLVFIS
jgi:hypothetical protein